VPSIFGISNTLTIAVPCVSLHNNIRYVFAAIPVELLDPAQNVIPVYALQSNVPNPSTGEVATKPVVNAAAGVNNCEFDPLFRFVVFDSEIFADAVHIGTSVEPAHGCIRLNIELLNATSACIKINDADTPKLTGFGDFETRITSPGAVLAAVGPLLNVLHASLQDDPEFESLPLYKSK
jgi:hypothetical protein